MSTQKEPGQTLYEMHARNVHECLGFKLKDWDHLSSFRKNTWKQTELQAILQIMLQLKQASAMDVHAGSDPDETLQKANYWGPVSDEISQARPGWNVDVSVEELGHSAALAIRQMSAIVKQLPQDREADVWDLQRDLMQRSKQDLPQHIMLTPQSLLYFALQLEELGEQGVAVHDGIHHGHIASPMEIGNEVEDAAAFSRIADTMRHYAIGAKKAAGHIRELIATSFGQRMPRVKITVDDAKEIADGAIDVAVTNAGFALSCGLPARQLYDNVVTSNLSKANPDTGVIDKHPDGKWIKGSAYQAPQIQQLIEPLMWEPTEDDPA